jgi:hypothetical protein
MAMSNLQVLRKVVFAATGCLAIGATALGDLMVTNAAGVRAGITGIVYRQSINQIAVDYAVSDPTGTNVTTFKFESSQDLKTWTNFTSSISVTGSTSGETVDFSSPQAKFYRMDLINFQ